MTKVLLIALVLTVAAVVTVIMIRHPRPSGQVPDLDAAAVETGKNLHPSTLNP